MMAKTMKISCNKVELTFKNYCVTPNLTALCLPGVRFDFHILLIHSKAFNGLAKIIIPQISEHALKSSDCI